jgi:hypothetical protein
MSRQFVSIWFFIGILLTSYGVLITAAGVYDLVVPPANPVHLAYLHAGIWWGALMLFLGLLYTIKFAPQKGTSKSRGQRG